MSNLIKIPFINPIKYTQVDHDQLPQYLSKHMDDFPYIDVIKNYQEFVPYFQVWGTSDSIRQQLYSNIAPVTLQVIDCHGNILLTSNFEQKQEDENNPTLFLYESDLGLNVFSPGVVFLQIEFAGGDFVMISEPQIISESIDDTLYLEFTNSKFYEGIIFEDGFSPTLRIHGQMNFKEPGSRRLVYEDDPMNTELLDAKNYRIWQFLIGGVTGIPDYMIDKINRILGCDSFRVDGRYFTTEVGAKLENEVLEFYPMRGWRIDMREKYNRNSAYFSTDIDTDGQFVMMANAESKGFIKNDAGGSYFQFINVE